VEAILLLIGLWIAWWLFGLVLRTGVGTIRATARTVMGKGSFADNFQAAVVGMGAMEARLVDRTLTDDPQSPKIKEVQVKGLFPIARKYRLGFVTSVFDETTGKYAPVISGVELFQEAHSRAYQHVIEAGSIEPGVGFVGWVRVGVVIPEILEPPYGGLRKFVAFLRLIDLDNKPQIDQGFHKENDSGPYDAWRVRVLAPLDPAKAESRGGCLGAIEVAPVTARPLKIACRSRRHKMNQAPNIKRSSAGSG
jgi:hypothetical protein